MVGPENLETDCNYFNNPLKSYQIFCTICREELCNKEEHWISNIDSLKRTKDLFLIEILDDNKKGSPEGKESFRQVLPEEFIDSSTVSAVVDYKHTMDKLKKEYEKILEIGRVLENEIDHNQKLLLGRGADEIDLKRINWPMNQGISSWRLFIVSDCFCFVFVVSFRSSSKGTCFSSCGTWGLEEIIW